MIRTAGIIGHGAIGVLFAAEFQKILGPDNLFVIADEERIRRYQTEGVYANGQKCAFRYVPYEQAEPVDLLIFATKYTGLAEAAAHAAPAIGPDTIVMSFLNGIVSEQMIEEALHPAHLLYCTVQGMDATRTGSHVVYQNLGSITFGEKDNTRSPQVCEAEAFFRSAGFPCSVPEDIMHQLWSKWMLNVGVNQTCAVHGVGYGGVQTEGALRTEMITAMEEARAVAAAEGVFLSEEERDSWVDLIDSLTPAGEPSMRQDIRAGRPTEVELFAGLVCRLGDKHGIAVPQNREFYQKLKE